MKYKARLVAKGYVQIEGIDYYLTYSPTLKADTMRLFLKIASINNWDIYQLDVNCAYLNAKLNEEVYLKIPMYGEGEGKGKVWRLKKSLYGLKQSAYEWNKEINNTLINMGLIKSNNDQCLYFKEMNGNISGSLLLYVDDILIIGDKHFIYETKQNLMNKYKCKDIGPAKYILGIEILKDKYNNYGITQRNYTKNLVEKYLNILSSRTFEVLTPGINKLEENEELENKTLYRSVVGALIHLYRFTRPDITFATNLAARFSNNPKKSHTKLIIKILRYLKGTTNWGITFNKERDFKFYTDADYNTLINDFKSNSGYILTIGNNPISWYSKKQALTSCSTTHAEINACQVAIKNVIWTINFINELNILHDNIINLHFYIDNKSSLRTIENRIINDQNKFYSRKVMFIADYLEEYNIKLEYIKTENNIADIFTKNLSPSKHYEFCGKIISYITEINNKPEFIEIKRKDYKINKNDMEIEEFNVNKRNNNEIKKSNDHMEF